MLFNSFEYIVFLPIVFTLFFFCKQKQYIVLLVASMIFYASWNIKYLFLFIAEILLSYFCAFGIDKYEDINKKRLFLALEISICLLLLFIFKYLNFCYEIVYGVIYRSDQSNPLNIILPIGISFYTFQCVAYVTDVYKRKIKCERNLLQFAAFISFFPQLVAGPIERAGHLLPQIKEKHYFDYNEAKYGLLIMSWGYFKKVIIADTLAITVDRVWGNLDHFDGLQVLVAVIFFGVQIYCDFSGYSDIAVGTAHLFGIKLSQNFRSPYYSKSLKEFWGRWHITLSNCLRDYIYIPLGGNREGIVKYATNIMLTFLISGIWHGANWTFLIWGGVTGLAYY